MADVYVEAWVLQWVGEPAGERTLVLPGQWRTHTLGPLGLAHRQVCIGPFYSGGWACREREEWACVTTQEVAVVVGDGRLQDSKFCNIRERQGEKDHQRSFRAETPLITNTRTPPCHDPPTITILPLTHRQTHSHTPHLLWQTPACKVDPYYPPSQTCSALSTSSGQLRTKKPEMWGVSATWPGSANPLTLPLSFPSSFSFLLMSSKKKELQFFFSLAW